MTRMVPRALTMNLVSPNLASIIGTEVPGMNLEVQVVMGVLGLCHQSIVLQWLKPKEVVSQKFWRLDIDHTKVI